MSHILFSVLQKFLVSTVSAIDLITVKVMDRQPALSPLLTAAAKTKATGYDLMALIMILYYIAYLMIFV